MCQQASQEMSTNTEDLRLQLLLAHNYYLKSIDKCIVDWPTAILEKVHSFMFVSNVRSELFE